MIDNHERCPLRGAEKPPGTTTFAVDLGFGVIVIRQVPALVCSQCGEAWIADSVASRLEAVVTAHARIGLSFKYCGGRTSQRETNRAAEMLPPSRGVERRPRRVPIRPGIGKARRAPRDCPALKPWKW